MNSNPSTISIPSQNPGTEIDGNALKVGDETKIDYRRMMTIVAAAGYRGRLGIEYEGERLSEPEGIRATKRLLERLRDELAKTPPK